ncbi:DivIVA domain-containing protein [Brochothrix thermosphacta]|uniref:DivIVA domain-containing protein n=1 Tax=Brochothrix thermosphacta TaxID=2756 RepID=UPI0039AEE311
MPLSPLDIHNKEFGKKLRGYDEDEVNDFLEQVIKDYELTIKEKKALASELHTNKEQLSHYKTIESTLNKSLVIAQDSADETRNAAQREAELIVREAQNNASEIVNEALTKTHRLAVEIEELKRQSKVFRERLRLLVTTQLDMLEHEDWSTSLEYDENVEERVTYAYGEAKEADFNTAQEKPAALIDESSDNSTKEVPAKD